MNNPKRFFATLFDPGDFKLILLAMGLFFTFLGIRAFWIYFQDKHTVRVTGQVIRSESRSNNNLDHPRTLYDFAYEYTFQDKTYTSTRYHYKSEDGHHEAVSLYRAGNPIIVFLDPGQPERAVIRRGWSWLNVFWVVLGLLVVYKVISIHYIQMRNE